MTRWLVLMVCVAMGCGSDRPLVVLQLAGRSAYQAVTVETTLNNAMSQRVAEFPPNGSELGLELPVHARGPVEVDVYAWDSAGACVVGFDESVVSVEHDDDIYVPISLRVVSPPVCQQ